MFNHPEIRLEEFCRVILTTELARVEQNSQGLRVRPRRPLRQKEKTAEEQYAAEQTAEKVESRRAHDERNEEQLSFRAQNRERFVDRLVSGVDTAFRHAISYDPGKSQDRKFTAAIAIPMPKTIPANIRLFPPSPKANIKPPTTIATRLKPFAIGPVKPVWSCWTAFSHGLLPDCRKISASIRFISHFLKRAYLLHV